MADQVDELVAWTLRMSRAEREAEPIHVTRVPRCGSPLIGFLALAIGESMLCWAPTGGRFEYILLTVGTLCLAVAILYHLDQHRQRFGLAALVAFNLAIVAASAVWLPFAIDVNNRGTEGRNALLLHHVGDCLDARCHRNLSGSSAQGESSGATRQDGSN
jgi:hypothetical protein